MRSASPGMLAIAAGLGSMLARLFTRPWPAGLDDWMGLLLFGAAVGVCTWLLLRFLARRRQS